MPSEFFTSLPEEEKERLKRSVEQVLISQRELNKDPLGGFVLTEQDIEKWANDSKNQNNFNNSNQNANGK